MNIKLVVIAILLLGVVGGGVWIVSSKNKAAKTEAPQVATSQEATSGGNLFTSIKDALSKSLSLECQFKNDTADQKFDVIAYIKNGAVRMSTKAEGKEGASEMILKDKKLYIWGSKEGAFVMDLPDGGQNANSADTLAELEKYKDSCKPTVVADSMFVPPADVKFQDLSKMMQQSGK